MTLRLGFLIAYLSALAAFNAWYRPAASEHHAAQIVATLVMCSAVLGAVWPVLDICRAWDRSARWRRKLEKELGIQ